jgi:DNA polymerase-1
MGRGDEFAKIMIVLDMPDKNDDVTNTIMRDGLYGGKLNFLLQCAGLTRKDVYITFSTKCHSTKEPKKTELEACRSHLKAEIDHVKPKAIVVMGKIALKSLLPKAGKLSDIRGFAQPRKDPETKEVLYWLIPTQTVGWSLQKQNCDDIIIRDLLVAKDMANGGSPRKLGISVRTHDTLEKVRAVVKELSESEKFSFDLETTGFDFIEGKIICFSFANRGDVGHVIPLYKHKEDGSLFWTEDEMKEVIDLMRDLFACPAMKIAQNGKYDLSFLKPLGISVRNYKFDTMLAHHLINVNHPHDLIFIAQWYEVIDIQYDAALERLKSELKIKTYDDLPCAALFKYAGYDAAVTFSLEALLAEDLKKYGLEEVFNEIAIPLNYVLHEMEFGGAKLDKPLLLRMSSTIEKRMKYALERVRLKVGDPEFNPLSPAHLKKVLTDCGALKGDVKKTKTGQVSVDVEVLESLVRRKRGKGIPDLILEMRQCSKLKSTYLDGRNGDDGLLGKLDRNDFLHTSFKIHGTVTGRLASASPNIQQIPNDIKYTDKDGVQQVISIRGLFIPDTPEDLLCSVDYKQLEVRIAAYLSGDPILLKEVADGVDMHSRNAAIVLLKVSEEEFIKILKDEKHPLHGEYKEARTAVKAVTFGVLYGSSAHGVSQRNNIDQELAEKFIKAFFKKYKVLHAWIKSQHSVARQTHSIRTMTNRVMRFPVLAFAKSRHCPDSDAKRIIGDVERVSVNAPIQSFGSDTFQKRKIKLRRQMILRKMKSRLILSLHDGFMLNVPPAEKDTVIEMIKKYMNVTLGKGTDREVFLEVDIKFSDRWGIVGDE